MSYEFFLGRGTRTTYHLLNENDTLK
jgi:hypothetical protein